MDCMKTTEIVYESMTVRPDSGVGRAAGMAARNLHRTRRFLGQLNADASAKFSRRFSATKRNGLNAVNEVYRRHVMQLTESRRRCVIWKLGRRGGRQPVLPSGYRNTITAMSGADHLSFCSTPSTYSVHRLETRAGHGDIEERRVAV